jgi:DnaJ-domain-containing protein 1
VPGRWSKRRKRDDDNETVDLGGPEHAWWAAPKDPDEEPAAPDAYEVLGVDESATWDEITAAHRKMVKALHPDQMVNAADDERARFENAMRDINAAYSELRTRRGR